jgi:hypothetical protein
MCTHLNFRSQIYRKVGILWGEGDAFLTPSGIFTLLFSTYFSPLSPLPSPSLPTFSLAGKLAWKFHPLSPYVSRDTRKATHTRLLADTSLASNSHGSGFPWLQSALVDHNLKRFPKSKKRCPPETCSMYLKDVFQVSSFVWLERHMDAFPISTPIGTKYFLTFGSVLATGHLLSTI